MLRRISPRRLCLAFEVPVPSYLLIAKRWARGERRCAWHRTRLETVDLDGLAIKAQALLLIGQEVLDIFALVALELNHLAHLGVGDDGAIAGEFLLDHLEDLLLVKLLG